MNYINMLNEYDECINDIKSCFDKCIESVKVHGDIEKEIVSALVINKINHGFSASIILMKSSLPTEAGYIFRSMIENYFVIRALERNSGDSLNRLWANEKIRYNKMKRKTVDNGKYPEHKQEFSNLKIEFGKSEGKTSVEEWARLADSTAEYDYVYSFLSDSAHVNHYSLREYSEFSEEGLVSLEKELDTYMGSLILDSLLRMILNLIETIQNIFELSCIDYDVLLDLEEKLEELFIKINPDVKS